MTLQITICGGGNAAHTLAGLLGSQEEVSVRVFVPFGDEARRWQAGVRENQGLTVETPEGLLNGTPQLISRDPAEAIPGAEIVFLALPAFAHEAIFQQIAPHLAPGTWVGALPARGGFDLAARNAFKTLLPQIVLFGFQTLPWACRIAEFGKRAAILGTKENVDLAALPHHQAVTVSRRLAKLLRIAISPVSSFLSLTLADTGQIIHPGIMYGLFQRWAGEVLPQPRLFYQSVDARIATLLQGMSDEVQDVRAALEIRFPQLDLSPVRPLGGWLQRAYRHSIQDASTLHSSFATNRSYAGLLAPMKAVDGGYLPDFQARYLSEDVPYNLAVTRGIAEIAGVETPTIDRVMTWAQERLGKEYLVDGKLRGADLHETRSPQRYGIARLEEIVQEAQSAMTEDAVE